jgi:hypothetical protein
LCLAGGIQFSEACAQNASAQGQVNAGNQQS